MNILFSDMTQPIYWYDILIAISSAVLLMIIFVAVLNSLRKTHDIKFSFTITKREEKNEEQEKQEHKV